MIVMWIIGVVLSFLGIYLYKNSRRKSYRKLEEPILKVWSLLLFALGSMVPIFNIFIALGMIAWWTASVYGDEDWLYPEDNIMNKFIQLLNKPVK